MKHLVLSLSLVLASALQAAELGKPGAPAGVTLTNALPAVVTTLPQTPGRLAELPALPATPLPARTSAAPPKISAVGGELSAAPQAGPPGRAQPSLGAGSRTEQPTALAQVRSIRARLEAQLKSMEAVLGAEDPVLAQVRAEAGPTLARIEAHVAAGRIDPSLTIRSHEDHPAAAAHRAPRVGVYPVAADPFQWAHLLIGLRAMAEFELDKVIYVLAGDDARKPHMTPVVHRHPMGQAVLEVFAPLFGYSPIAVGTSHDGETNIFRMLALNAGQAVHAFYLVGGDHYKLQDKNGNDDTIPKIEKKQADASLGHDPDNHKVSVAFIARGDEGAEIPTPLDVRMLPAVTFEASSTLVRQGKLALMPHAAYQWVLDNLPGHYGIEKPQ